MLIWNSRFHPKLSSLTCSSFSKIRVLVWLPLRKTLHHSQMSSQKYLVVHYIVPAFSTTADSIMYLGIRDSQAVAVGLFEWLRLFSFWIVIGQASK
jgi:hypothetical protein